MSDLNQLDRLLARWQDLCEQGPPPTAAEVCADCPELARAFQIRLQGMERMGARLEIDASGAGQEASLLETSRKTAGGNDLRAAVGHQKGDGPVRAGEEEPPDNDAGSTGIEKGVAGTESGLSFLDPPDAPGSLGRLGPYRVLDVLGEGGMGIVLKAEEPQPRRLVAIKVMRPERTTHHSRQRFLREGQALASVEHERVVPVYRVDEVRGVPFLVMPLLLGESLRERLRRDGRAPLAEVLRIGREVAEGLAAAHAAGLIHRDVKPSNIWLRGPEARVVLLDFGLARLASGTTGAGPGGVDETDLTSIGSVLGTVGYMAPEQAAGKEVDSRADLFSLGCVLYELAVGERPFTGPDALVILSALANHEPPPPREVRADVPAALSALIVRLLAKSPERRPQAAPQVVTALKAIEQRAGDDPATTEWEGLPASSAAVDDSRGIRKNSGASLDGEVNSWDGLPAPSMVANDNKADGLGRPSHVVVQSALGGLPNTADTREAPPVRTGLLAVVFAPLLMLVRTRIKISVKIKVVVVSAALLLLTCLVTLPVTSVAFSVTVSAALLLMTGVSFAFGYRGIAAIASKIASKGVWETVVFGTSAIVALAIGYYVLCYANPKGNFLDLPPDWFPWKIEVSDSEGG